MFLPGSSIADIACGSGRDLVAGTRNHMVMYGSDIAPGQVAVARKVHPVVCVASFCDLPYPAHSMDGIWACAAIVHADDNLLSQTLNEFARVLAPGGLLYMNTKSLDGTVSADGYDRQGRWFHLRGASELCETMTSHGWDILTVSETQDPERGHITWVETTATHNPARL